MFASMRAAVARQAVATTANAAASAAALPARTAAVRAAALRRSMHHTAHLRSAATGTSTASTHRIDCRIVPSQLAPHRTVSLRAASRWLLPVSGLETHVRASTREGDA
jgi:hypothetical protein